MRRVCISSCVQANAHRSSLVYNAEDCHHAFLRSSSPVVGRFPDRATGPTDGLIDVARNDETSPVDCVGGSGDPTTTQGVSRVSPLVNRDSKSASRSGRLTPPARREMRAPCTNSDRLPCREKETERQTVTMRIPTLQSWVRCKRVGARCAHFRCWGILPRYWGWKFQPRFGCGRRPCCGEKQLKNRYDWVLKRYRNTGTKND